MCLRAGGNMQNCSILDQKSLFMPRAKGELRGALMIPGWFLTLKTFLLEVGNHPLDFLRFPAKVAHQNPTFVSEIPQEKTVSIWLRKGNPTGISRRQSLWVILDLLSVRGPASFFQVWALFEPKIGEIFGISPTGSNSF